MTAARTRSRPRSLPPAPGPREWKTHVFASDSIPDFFGDTRCAVPLCGQRASHPVHHLPPVSQEVAEFERRRFAEGEL